MRDLSVSIIIYGLQIVKISEIFNLKIVCQKEDYSLETAITPWFRFDCFLLPQQCLFKGYKNMRAFYKDFVFIIL